MKLFKIYRTDEIDYDEHKAIVVRAKDADRAQEIAFTGYYDEPFLGFKADNVVVEEIPADGDEAVILDSFNAG